MPSKPSFCPKMREILIESLEVAGVPHHKEAKTVTIEGPRFSTFAESELFRDVFRAQIVNMTTVPEGTDILFFENLEVNWLVNLNSHTGAWSL